MRVFRVVIEAGSMTFPNFYLLPLTTVDSAASPGSKIIVIELPHAVIKTFLSAEARPNYCAKFRKLRVGVGKVVEIKKIYRVSASLQGHATSIQLYRRSAFNGSFSNLHILSTKSFIFLSACRFELCHRMTRFDVCTGCQMGFFFN